jgi:integrase
MSAAKGINYLNSKFHQYLYKPPEEVLKDPEVSGIAHVLNQLMVKGLDTPGYFNRATVEWLLVHIVTELGVTPHTLRHGHNTLGMMPAYQDIFYDLVGDARWFTFCVHD